MSLMVQEIEAPDARAAIAREVLEALPDWFGIPESREAYIRDSRAQPFWADLEGDTAQGFLALKETSPYTAELAVMGVLPEYHRRGIGRALFAAAKEWAGDHGGRKLYISAHSAVESQAFYKAMGCVEAQV